MWQLRFWAGGANGGDSQCVDYELAQQINKRLTLNLLIQGAAAHTFLTASYLVESELEAIRPGLTELYTRLAISGQLNYSIGDNALVFGWPNRCWGHSRTPQPALRRHPLLAKHGNSLARQSTRYLQARARVKHLTTIPVLHWFQFMRLMVQVSIFDGQHADELGKLAVKAATEIWQIPANRLDASITQQPAFGNLQTPRTKLGKLCRHGVIGYGGVERRAGTFFVVAKAWVFPILLHELIKGTVELICLHGLSELGEDVYQAVVAEADQLEYEAWLLQAGPALWRKVLAVTPRDRSLAHTIMQLARLEPLALHELLLLVIEDEQQAKRRFFER